MQQTPRRVAYARLHLPDGTVLERQTVCFDAAGRPFAYEPLTHETPFTEWHNRDFYWPPGCVLSNQ